MDTASQELAELVEEEALVSGDPAASEEPEGRKEEGAAGLIEIAAVILVVAILTIGGLFLFGAFSGGSQDSVAQQNASNTLTDARATLATNGGAYPATATLITDLGTAEPNINYTNGAATSTAGSKMQVSVASSGTTVDIASASPSGNCFWIQDNAASTGGTQYQQGTTAGGACDAANAPTTGWTSTQW